MVTTRTPRGYGVYHKGIQEIQPGQRPSLSDLKPLLPAPWLPVSRIEKLHDDPQVIPAGTLVGRINATDHADIYTAVPAAKRTNYLVPCFAGAGEYTLTYTQDDIDYSTPDIDSYPTVVAAAGTSTLDIPAVKPLGIMTYDCYASHMNDTWKNYLRQHMVTFLSWGYTVMIPVRTAAEATLQIGDVVQVEDNSGSDTTWTPKAATNIVGRMKLWETGDTPEFKVGRVIEKIDLATQTASVANQLLSAGFTAGNYGSPHDFGGLAKVLTVPGMGLSGSGTAGIPRSMFSAVAQSQVWSALLISISVL